MYVSACFQPMFLQSSTPSNHLFVICCPIRVFKAECALQPLGSQGSTPMLLQFQSEEQQKHQPVDPSALEAPEQQLSTSGMPAGLPSQIQITQVAQQPNQPSKQVSPLRKPRKIMKNSQPNILNQAFSFLLSRSRSTNALLKTLKNLNGEAPQKRRLFYIYVRLLRHLKKGYMSRRVISQLCFQEGGELQGIITSNEEYRQEVLSIRDFRRLARVLVRVYLTNYSPAAMLTSKKLSRKMLFGHFERRRELIRFLSE